MTRSVNLSNSSKRATNHVPPSGLPKIATRGRFKSEALSPLPTVLLHTSSARSFTAWGKIRSVQILSSCSSGFLVLKFMCMEAIPAEVNGSAMCSDAASACSGEISGRRRNSCQTAPHPRAHVPRKKTRRVPFRKFCDGVGSMHPITVLNDRKEYWRAPRTLHVMLQIVRLVQSQQLPPSVSRQARKSGLDLGDDQAKECGVQR